jgi:phosphoribosyl 1,2-cyclic phosphodiesterase
MRVRFYGVRGSIATAGDETRRYGGNTSCVVVEAGGETIIFDAGTGLRKAGADLMTAHGPSGVNAHLFFSHLHWDHIQGFPFFGPAFVPGNRLSVWGVQPKAGVVDDGDHHPATLELNLEALQAPDPSAGVRAAMASQMQAPNFPVGLDAMRADLRFHDLPFGEKLTLSPFVTVRHVGVDHPNGCVAWRVDADGHSVVYATDLELAEGEGGAVFDGLVELSRGADVLVFDAMYTPEEYTGSAKVPAPGIAAGGLFSRRGWGHSTFEMGAAVAEKAGVKSLALFHHDPAHDDVFMDALGERAAARRPGTIVAREGMELAL